MSEGQAFLFTPGGPVAFPTTSTILSVAPDEDPNEMASSVVYRTVGAGSRSHSVAQPQQVDVDVGSFAGSIAAAPITSPGAVIKAAKARVTQIRAELRNMKRLQKELTELERLITAAKKPVAAVRNIDQARHAR